MTSPPARDGGPDRVLRRALGLLARRDHSRAELLAKLVRSGHERAEAERTVEGLARQGLVSDSRFAEAFVRSRIERGGRAASDPAGSRGARGRAFDRRRAPRSGRRGVGGAGPGGPREAIRRGAARGEERGRAADPFPPGAGIHAPAGSPGDRGERAGMNTSNELRAAFLDYFRSRGHEVVASSSLVPGNDPTLLFTNSGMVQFKDVFLGADPRSYTRAVTSQRCVGPAASTTISRTWGTRPAITRSSRCLETSASGTTSSARAIAFAWEFLTREMGLARDRMWITVFEDDDEAEDIWRRDVGRSSPPASCDAERRTTSGRWGTSVRAVPAPRCSTTTARKSRAARPGHPTRTGTASSRSGTSSSCSSTGTPTGT